MCGRYTLKAPREAIAEAFDLAEVPQLLPRYNIAPTQPVPVFPKRQLTTGFALLDAVLSECAFLPSRKTQAPPQSFVCEIYSRGPRFPRIHRLGDGLAILCGPSTPGDRWRQLT